MKYVTFILYFYLRQCRLPAEPSYESFLEDDDDGDDHVGRLVQILFVYCGFIYMCLVLLMFLHALFLHSIPSLKLRVCLWK